MLSLRDLQKLAFLLEKSNWIFAKTMPNNPHFYSLRLGWNKEDFEWVVNCIRNYGYINVYKGREYTCLNVNGYMYWTMGAEIEETILINRKPVRGSSYDLIAEKYSGLYLEEEFTEEDIEVVSRVGYKEGRLLDIGCGTGLYTRYVNVSPEKYLGIDPSEKMLNVFSYQQFKKYKTICTKFEDFAAGSFDYIISLYGAISYIDPRYLSRLNEILNPGGKIFLMFYSKEYTPITYHITGIEFQHYGEKGAQVLHGYYKYPLGNYLVCTYGY